ncbi:MAG: voltage-gated chloride channel family protein [Cytophagales bacterium]|nr:voltage-gated chloride channel family protein [Cytophagales bacterium]
MRAKYKIEQIPILLYTLRWLVIASIIGVLVGIAGAGFLYSLQWATDWRESHQWIIWLLPIGGAFVGLLYHYWGKEVEGGNNLLLEEIHNPKKIIPFKMAPLVLFGTIMTHLFGGSAGREGTAVQMGASISDQLTRIFRLKPRDRKMIVIAGISAGFAAVFGTPLAGAIFGLEVYFIGKMRYTAIIPSFFAAIVGNYTTHHLVEYLGMNHTHYDVGSVIPEMTPLNLGLAIIAGILFGLAGRAFSKSTAWVGAQFKKYVKYPPLRPFIGGLVLAIVVWLMGTTRYIGLGVPTIVEAFHTPLPYYAFAIKLLLTAWTLGAGYKGGEVTPLFFIGATLGNALSFIMPLPMGLLAGMGFVAVFAAAANTPIACIFMAIELFGGESGLYVAIACLVAYFFSGHSGIYKSQIIGQSKHLLYGREEGEKLGDIK